MPTNRQKDFRLWHERMSTNSGNSHHSQGHTLGCAFFFQKKPPQKHTRTRTFLTKRSGPIHTGSGTRCTRRRKQMGPVDVNGGVHTACKQHQRKIIQIYAWVASRVLCGLGLSGYQCCCELIWPPFFCSEIGVPVFSFLFFISVFRAILEVRERKADFEGLAEPLVQARGSASHLSWCSDTFLRLSRAKLHASQILCFSFFSVLSFASVPTTSRATALNTWTRNHEISVSKIALKNVPHKNPTL